MKQETRLFLYDILSETLMNVTEEYISMQYDSDKPGYRKLLQDKTTQLQSLLAELIDNGEFK